MPGTVKKTARQIATETLSKPYIQDALREKETELKRHLDISKAAVIGELRAAIDIAEGKMDAGSMIRAWCEIAKMLGLYAPEAIKVALSAESEVLRAKFETMSDDELLAIAEGRAVA